MSARKEHSLSSQVCVWLTQPSDKIHYVCNNSSLSGGHRLQIMYIVWGHRSLVGKVCKKTHKLQVTAHRLQQKKNEDPI